MGNYKSVAVSEHTYMMILRTVISHLEYSALVSILYDKYSFDLLYFKVRNVKHYR